MLYEPVFHCVIRSADGAWFGGHTAFSTGEGGKGLRKYNIITPHTLYGMCTPKYIILINR